MPNDRNIKSSKRLQNRFFLNRSAYFRTSKKKVWSCRLDKLQIDEFLLFLSCRLPETNVENIKKGLENIRKLSRTFFRIFLTISGKSLANMPLPDVVSYEFFK